MSITSQSLMRSRGTTHSTTNQSVKSDMRTSIESSIPPRPSIDEEAQRRAVKRRQALREIITTESDYVFGLKALTDVLLLFSARLEIYHNLQQIREIHGSFLRQIRNVTPMSNLAGPELERFMSREVPRRFSPVDLSFKSIQNRSLRAQSLKATINSRLKALAAEANEALEVAREIEKLSMSFTVYKDFCNNYDQLVLDMDILRQSIPNWAVYDLGIEALSKSVASMENQALEPNRSMCLNDLLIKPIQRVCKYPLLLQELLKWTHIQDDPSAHDGIQEVLELVRGLVSQINDAPGNPINKKLIKQTFLLQDMLGLPKSCVVHDIYGQLGPMSLCGVLHVTYQSLGHLTGGYMVCVLFKSHFLLAKVNEDYRKLQAVACLYICDLKIDIPTNGKGLWCHGCLFSWKMVFQFEDEKFELVLSASSANEEKLWKTGLLRSIAASADAQKPVSSGRKVYSFLSLDLTPLDQPSKFEPPLCHRPSVHSLASPRNATNLQHVVIKKTHCPHRLGDTAHHVGELERPKISSSLSPLILTSRRQERVRLERVISPIYTREILPYPGMKLTKGDILFRPGSIMRRLSLRPGLHRRFSSVHLPSQRLTTSATTESDEKAKEPDNGGESEVVHESEGEKGRMLSACNVRTIGRSKTLRLRSSRQDSSPDLQLSTKEERHHVRCQSPSMKASIRTMLNSMSLRRAKRDPRLSLASGGR